MKSLLLALAVFAVSASYAQSVAPIDKLEEAALHTFSVDNKLKLPALVWTAGVDKGTAAIAPANQVKVASFKHHRNDCELTVLAYESYAQHCASSGWCSEPLAPYGAIEDAQLYNNPNGRLVLVSGFCREGRTQTIYELHSGSASELKPK